MLPQLPGNQNDEWIQYLISFGAALIVLHHQLEKRESSSFRAKGKQAQHMKDSCPNLPFKNTSNQDMRAVLFHQIDHIRDKQTGEEVLFLQGSQQSNRGP